MSKKRKKKSTLWINRVLNQFLQRSINQWFIVLNVTIITLLVLKRSKTPAPKGPSQLTRLTATQSTPIYCINSVTSGYIWSFYLSADCVTNCLVAKLTQQSRIGLMKTNVWTRLFECGLFSSLWMVFFAAKACSLNHCNKPDPSQSFDSSETRLPSFYAAQLGLAQEETQRVS